MGRSAGRSGLDPPPAQVRDLDPETLGRVQSFLYARAHGQTAETTWDEAWERFYAACAPLIRKLAHRGPGRHSHDDDDRAQDVWPVLLNHFSQYDPRRGSFPCWFSRVVRNAIATHDRSDHPFRQLDIQMERQLPSREVDPPNRPEPSQARRAIESAMNDLRSQVSEVTYRIVNAHCVEGKGFAEIAATLGLTVKQVRDRHHRAVEKLRRILARRHSNGRR